MSAGKSLSRARARPAAYKPREPGSLKAATAELVAASGGLDRAAHLVRVGRSTLARYSDPVEAGVYMPADVVRALELACGRPVVTAYLAAEQGCALSCFKYDPRPATLADDVAELSRDFGVLFGDAAKSLAGSGGAELGPADAQRLIADADRAIAVLFHLRGKCAERREG
jgi:hypothetical protein